MLYSCNGSLSAEPWTVSPGVALQAMLVAHEVWHTGLIKYCPVASNNRLLLDDSSLR